MRGKPLEFKTLDNGCIVPLHHKLNQDGYFRFLLRNKDGKGRGKYLMYHRYIYEQTYGALPDGYEIHHTCHNRACCNINHLELIEGHTHAILSDMERYAKRQMQAKKYWLATHCTGACLGEIFGVSFSTGCKWIRGWKV